MANTVWNGSDKTANCTLSGGNLIATSASAGINSVRAVDKQALGKFYWECTCNITTTTNTGPGIATSNLSLSANQLTAAAVGCSAVTKNGNIYVDGVNTGVPVIGALTNGSVVCIACDATARTVWYRLGVAGNWNGSAANNPATGVGGIAVNSLGNGFGIYPITWFGASGDQVTANFGDTAFVGAVPSGYTSGFTAGASVPTNALASQVAAEHWLTTNPAAQVTSVVAEHWASVTSDNLQAVVTFVALEHWTSVAVVVPAAGGPMVTMIH